MAWTSPMTAAANSTFTAAQFNTHVRDNLNETAPAKATTAGRIFVATGSNSIAERAVDSDSVTTSETTTSSSYTDLATSGPSVTATTGTLAVAMFAAQMTNNTGGELCATSVLVSGATSISALDDNALMNDNVDSTDENRGGQIVPLTLTAGSNTFTLKYRVSGGTGTFRRRTLVVVAL